MAMTLPIAIPPTLSSSSTPSSDESNTPHTPISPAMSQAEQKIQQSPSLAVSQPSQPGQQQQQSSNNNGAVNMNMAANNANGQVKRKPSRRANTAERRATHNAVERQRRETLNGRFLDLAALLPNLSQIRRPSKSSIVNSSIAHIHASRRHRMLAARELRLLKLEADALRRELNEWRDRAGIPRIEEPLRSDGFSMVISGELEVLAAVPGEEEDDEPLSYPGYEEDDRYSPSHVIVPSGTGMPSNSLDEMEDPRMALLKNQNTFPHNMPSQQNHHNAGNNNGLHLAHILPRPAAPGNAGPMIASPTSVTFGNPSMPAIYDSHGFPGAQFVQPPQQQVHSHVSLESEKIAAWNAAQMYHGQHPNGQQMMQAQRSLFTPPASSHGMSSGSSGHSNAGSHPPSNGSASPSHASSSSPMSSHSSVSPISGPFNDPASQAFFMQRPQASIDDAASVGSNRGHRERDVQMEHDQPFGDKPTITTAVSSVRDRSGNLNIASPLQQGGGSPVYELRPNGHGDYTVGVPRRGSAHGTIWMRDNDITMSSLNVGMGMGVGVGMPTVTVGGGGNGNGFAMMM
ncbi:hypothetical protein AMATHDRAFT_82582 [Amanita thiersii Skay4041]|uniref:BHLH domain-containing protein n=1 Tax=Amanita thiersii Skay4041 TaxID=703135 RepID=A0A2A9NDX2_9AGAR|nr:hypothetical protein AMATHDRAFT_82582 [Amanita thiersii Skay4041]